MTAYDWLLQHSVERSTDLICGKVLWSDESEAAINHPGLVVWPCPRSPHTDLYCGLVYQLMPAYCFDLDLTCHIRKTFHVAFHIALSRLSRSTLNKVELTIDTLIDISLVFNLVSQQMHSKQVCRSTLLSAEMYADRDVCCPPEESLWLYRRDRLTDWRTSDCYIALYAIPAMHDETRLCQLAQWTSWYILDISTRIQVFTF